MNQFQQLIVPAGKQYPPYVWWEKGFSHQEIQEIRKLALAANEEAKIGSGDIDPNIRRSNIKWVKSNKNTAWIYERLADITEKVNLEHYGFNLTGFGEALQLTNYRSENQGNYIWHQDFGATGVSRKLSIVMQLTDPSEYEGGNLEILTRANPDIVRKELGLIAFFPSWTLHQVTPVTRGERQTLVTWATGPNFT